MRSLCVPSLVLLWETAPFIGGNDSLSKHSVLKILVPMIPEAQLSLSVYYIWLHPLFILLHDIPSFP